MPVTLSIKSVPDSLAERLRQRAARNHRSLQGELMTIIEQAGQEPQLDIQAVYEEIQRLGLKTSNESAAMLREMRDGRNRG